MSLTDVDTPIATLKAQIATFADERDWVQFHSPKNLSMAIASEAAELMELFLWCDGNDASSRVVDERRDAVEAELADIVIYCLELANIIDIDVSDAVAKKMAVNAQKYPIEKARSNAKKYTEL